MAPSEELPEELTAFLRFRASGDPEAMARVTIERLPAGRCEAWVKDGARESPKTELELAAGAEARVELRCAR